MDWLIVAQCYMFFGFVIWAAYLPSINPPYRRLSWREQLIRALLALGLLVFAWFPFVLKGLYQDARFWYQTRKPVNPE